MLGPGQGSQLLTINKPRREEDEEDESCPVVQNMFFMNGSRLRHLPSGLISSEAAALCLNRATAYVAAALTEDTCVCIPVLTTSL